MDSSYRNADEQLFEKLMWKLQSPPTLVKSKQLYQELNTGTGRYYDKPIVTDTKEGKYWSVTSDLDYEESYKLLDRMFQQNPTFHRYVTMIISMLPIANSSRQRDLIIHILNSAVDQNEEYRYGLLFSLIDSMSNTKQCLRYQNAIRMLLSSSDVDRCLDMVQGIKEILFQKSKNVPEEVLKEETRSFIHSMLNLTNVQQCQDIIRFMVNYSDENQAKCMIDVCLKRFAVKKRHAYRDYQDWLLRALYLAAP